MIYNQWLELQDENPNQGLLQQTPLANEKITFNAYEPIGNRGRCLKVCAITGESSTLNLDMLMWTYLTGGTVIGMPPCLVLACISFDTQFGDAEKLTLINSFETICFFNVPLH